MDKILKLIHQSNHPLFDIEVNPNGWVMPNKAKFTKNWIEHTFKYKIDTRPLVECSECKDDICPIADKINLFPYQKFVKDYIQFDSPYRGLLLYMGVGIGKSCTSIAAAEILLGHMNVIIMTPASLRSNYIQEIKKCGRRFYQKKQKWAPVTLDSLNLTILERKNVLKLLNISEDFVNAYNNRIWFPINKGKMYDSLSINDKNHIDAQINNVINNSFDFINYNGLRTQRKNMDIEIKKNKITYISDMIKDGNPFDNKCVIVDEIHNLVSRVVNKGKVGTALYNLLMNAKNCKLILLSGTPIINYPFEIGYILNILKGYQYIYYCKLGNMNIDINDFLEKIPYIDNIDINTINKQINITLLPEGFIYTNRNKLIVSRYSDPITINDIKILIKEYLKRYKLKSFIENRYIEFPIEEKDFNGLYLNEEKMIIKNKNLFAKKTLGIVSYYSNYDKKLYPDVNIHEEYIYLSDQQFSIYETYRSKERIMERNSKNQKSKQSSVYRFYSRACGNFTFPSNIKRPFPSDINKEDPENENNDENENEYNKKIKIALDKLSKDEHNYLHYNNLHKLSPKMKLILSRLMKHKKSLIYSQFRKIEGIGIMKLILEKNGWSEFKLKKIDNLWQIDENSLNNKPKFMIFQGNGEDTQLLLKIFNRDIENIPNNIKDQIDLSENVIDIIFITVSGAEGISLKEVREVHILEPYWNYIRIEQVIGRAVRTCSHVTLPENERNVDVYIYNTKYTEEQIKSSMSITLQDKGFTSDEHIYNSAKAKNKVITELLDILKSTAVDCSLNSNSHKLKCFSFPANIEDNMDVNNIHNIDEITDKKQWNGYILNTKKGIYIVNEDTNEVYDYEIYINSQKVVKIGILKTINNKKVIAK